MTMQKPIAILLALALCAGVYAAETETDPDIDNLLKKAKAKKGYKPLFKKDLSDATMIEGMWEFKEGVLAPTAEAPKLSKPKVAKGKAKGPKPMRDVWTKKRYGDFILDLEFKCEPETNSGVFVRTDDVVQWLHTGMEIQIMQNKSAKSARNDTGAVYDCLAPTSRPIKKTGEWNQFTVICNGKWIHVVLNGKRVTDMNLDLWTEAHKNPDGSPNKFNTAYKDMKREGHVGLQYHGHPVWFRNVKIKPLNSTRNTGKKAK